MVALALRNRGLLPDNYGNSSVVNSSVNSRTVPYSVNTTPRSNYSFPNFNQNISGSRRLRNTPYSVFTTPSRLSASNNTNNQGNYSFPTFNPIAKPAIPNNQGNYSFPTFNPPNINKSAKVPPNQLGQNLLNFATSGAGGAFGQGLLDKSGYSTMPVSFGEALASGMKSMSEFNKETKDAEFEREKFEYLQSQDAITNALELQKNLKGDDKTANIKDFNFYKSLSKEDQEIWDKIDKNHPGLAAMMAGAVTAAEQGTDNVVSPGQLAFDKTAGESLSKFVIEELPQQLANIDKIDDVIAIMKTQEVTGPVEGGTPYALKLFTNPESIGVEDDIRSIIYQSLRATLGAQFTEKEGERLVAATFNKYLSEEVNIARLERLREETVRGLDTKSEMYNYLQENGTLKGWEGPELLTGSKYKENKSSLQQSLFDVSDYDGLDSDQLLEIYESDISKEEKLFIYNNLEALGIS